MLKFLRFKKNKNDDDKDDIFNISSSKYLNYKELQSLFLSSSVN